MKYHLIGIGGVGMSALATALKLRGAEVSGSDRARDTPNLSFLKSLGIKIYPDDGSGVDSTIDELIVSTAIEETNATLRAARELGIKITHRAVALSEALSSFKLIAVAGTCGKSTVTAMLGHILSESKLDPFCVNGANVPGWIGAVRNGNGAFAVAEVDESDKSLVAFNPFAAIITNASADHYSKEEMNAVFDAFIKNIKGPVIDGRLISGEVATSLPGRHNRANAFLALQMALALGCNEDDARKALLSFNGVERRMQKIAPSIYDDYAHNPEKIRAFWLTLAETYDSICVIWRPHGYGPLKKMMDDLSRMFNETMRKNDKLLLLPVYDAGGSANRTVNSVDLATLLGEKCVCVNDYARAIKWVKEHKKDYACFATCGARDPDLPKLARALALATQG